MKLKTWAFYDAKKLVDVKHNLLLENDIVFLVLRPDINEPNKLLGFGLPKENSATVIVDLQNKELSQEELYAIFQGNLGMTDTVNIKEIEIQDNNLSTPIREENIKNLIEIYSVFFKSESIEFDTEDYSKESDMQKEDIFTDLNFNSMSIQTLMQSLKSGMGEYNRQINFLQTTQMSEEERKNKILEMSVLQSNLILFFDNALIKMNNIIVQQQEEIKKLKESN